MSAARAILGWSLRISAWCAVLVFSIYVICNWRGIWVRGRMARAWHSDNDTALILSLARRAGLKEVVEAKRPLVVTETSGWRGLCGPLRRRYSAITFAPEGHESDGSDAAGGWPRTLVYDPDGELVGAMSGPPEREGYKWLETQVIGVRDGALLIVQYHNWHEPALLDVYLVEPAGGRLVLALWSRAEFIDQRILRETPDRVILQLHLIFGHHAYAGESLLDFTWDDAGERFILPSPDPEGLWRVDFPSQDELDAAPPPETRDGPS